MQSLNDALFLLEKTFKRLESYLKNIEAENSFLSNELSKKEEAVHYFSKYKRVTLEKLKEVKRALGEEIHSDVKGFSSKKLDRSLNGKLNILMLEEDEESSES